MVFPQTPDEFQEIYFEDSRVEVNMTESKNNPPAGEGWEQYAKRVQANNENGEQDEYYIWYRIV